MPTMVYREEIELGDIVVHTTIPGEKNKYYLFYKELNYLSIGEGKQYYFGEHTIAFCDSYLLKVIK